MLIKGRPEVIFPPEEGVAIILDRCFLLDTVCALTNSFVHHEDDFSAGSAPRIVLTLALQQRQKEAVGFLQCLWRSHLQLPRLNSYFFEHLN